MTWLISSVPIPDAEQVKIEAMVAARLSAFENSSLEEQHKYRLAQKINYMRSIHDAPRSKEKIDQIILEYETGFAWAGVLLADAEFRELLSLI